MEKVKSLIGHSEGRGRHTTGKAVSVLKKKKKKKQNIKQSLSQGKALGGNPELGPWKAGALGHSHAVKASHTLHVSEICRKRVLLTAVL